MFAKGDPVVMVHVGTEDGSWFGQQTFVANVISPVNEIREMSLMIMGANAPMTIGVAQELPDSVSGMVTNVFPAGKRWLVRIRHGDLEEKKEVLEEIGEVIGEVIGEDIGEVIGEDIEKGTGFDIISRDLMKMTIPQLKSYAVKIGIEKLKGKKKENIIHEISLMI